MARISGVDLPREKRVEIGLTYIYGIGRTSADQILKAAEMQAIELRLGNGLGGKAYFTYTGDVAAVKAGTDTGEAIAQEKGLLVNSEVIPSPSELLVPSLL